MSVGWWTSKKTVITSTCSTTHTQKKTFRKLNSLKLPQSNFSFFQFSQCCMFSYLPPVGGAGAAPLTWQTPRKATDKLHHLRHPLSYLSHLPNQFYARFISQVFRSTLAKPMAQLHTNIKTTTQVKKDGTYVTSTVEEQCPLLLQKMNRTINYYINAINITF